jgi:hypothetical protein
VRKLVYLHLKKDLEVNPKDWIGCPEPHDLLEKGRPAATIPPHTSYGIPKKIQDKIAGIRTDLDSFSDKEAFALMTSGYRMAEVELNKQFVNLSRESGDPPGWNFLTVEKLIHDQYTSRELNKLLKVAGSTALKIWLLSQPLKITGIIISLTAVAAFIVASYIWPSLPLVTLGMIGTSVLFLIIGLFVGKTILRIVNFRETLTQIAIGIGMSILGWAVARLHLHVFDRWFLNYGSMKRRH